MVYKQKITKNKWFIYINDQKYMVYTQNATKKKWFIYKKTTKQKKLFDVMLRKDSFVFYNHF